MAGDEAFLMTSLVLILAIFIRRRSFLQRMRLMSLHMNCSGTAELVMSCNALTGSARRRREIKRVLAEELEKLTGPEEL